MGRYTGFVYDRDFSISKRLFRNKFDIKMHELCGWETSEMITTKNRRTQIITLNSLEEAELFQKNITELEKKDNFKNLEELIQISLKTKEI